MRSSPFTVIYDANVLYPAPLRDFLMHLALTGVYRARWSALIHEEWKRNLLKNRQDITREQVDKTSQLMDRAIPDALVSNYEPLIEGLELPDRDDRHVLAAAIKCNASAIVTFNLKDFPASVLTPLDIEPIHPDSFIADLWDLDKAAVIKAAHDHRVSLKNPPYSVDGYLDRLLKQGLPDSVNYLSEFSMLI